MVRSKQSARQKKNAPGDEGGRKKVIKKGTHAKPETPTQRRRRKKGEKPRDKPRTNDKGKNAKKKEPEKKPLTAEELDRQMDDYMMKDKKVAAKKLEDDMDDYWAQKKAKDAESEGGKDTAVDDVKKEAAAES